MALPEGRSAGAVAPRSRAAARGRGVAARSLRPWHGCRIHPSSSQLAPEGALCLEQGSRSRLRKERPKSAAPSPPLPSHHATCQREPQLAVPPARTLQPWGHQRAPRCFRAPRAAASTGPHRWLRPQSSQQLSPGLSSAAPGQFAATASALPCASLCRLPFPGRQAGRVLARPSPAPLPAAPRAVPAHTSNYDFCLWAITDLIAALPGEGRPGCVSGSAPHGAQPLCQRSWSRQRLGAGAAARRCRALHKRYRAAVGAEPLHGAEHGDKSSGARSLHGTRSTGPGIRGLQLSPLPFPPSSPRPVCRQQPSMHQSPCPSQAAHGSTWVQACSPQL